MATVSTPENLAILAALAEALRALNPGETLHKKQLANLLQGKHYLLSKARRMVEEELGCVFATIIRTGVKRLEVTHVVAVGEKARVTARRRLGRAQGQIVGVVRSSEGIMRADDKLKLTNELNKLGLAVEYCG